MNIRERFENYNFDSNMIEEILLLHAILKDYSEDKEYKQFLDKNYDIQAMSKRYFVLGQEYLKQYALNNTEKSE